MFSEEKAYRQGRDAYVLGCPLKACPYGDVDLKDNRGRCAGKWGQGWMDQHKESPRKIYYFGCWSSDGVQELEEKIEIGSQVASDNFRRGFWSFDREDARIRVEELRVQKIEELEREKQALTDQIESLRVMRFCERCGKPFKDLDGATRCEECSDVNKLFEQARKKAIRCG